MWGSVGAGTTPLQAVNDNNEDASISFNGATSSDISFWTVPLRSDRLVDSGVEHSSMCSDLSTLVLSDKSIVAFTALQASYRNEAE